MKNQNRDSKIGQSLLAILIIWNLLPSANALLSEAIPPAFIYDLWPSQGSIAGGTYLTIKGLGWARNGLPGATVAYLNEKECIQNQGSKLDSTDTNLVCWTPPGLKILLLNFTNRKIIHYFFSFFCHRFINDTC